MMKYLPYSPDRKTDGAKATIYNDWRKDFNGTMGQIQKRFQKLNDDKMQDAMDLIEGKIVENKKASNTLVDQSKKKSIINLEVDTGCGSWKQLMKNLERVCNFYNIDQDNLFRSSVPIYKPKKYQNDQEKAVKHNLGYGGPSMSIREYCLRPIAFAKINEDKKDNEEFTQVRNQKTKTQKAKSGNKLKIVQIKKDGKERYFLVKKKEKPISSEAEEIFAEWLSNLEMPNNFTRSKSIRKRQRKLSHRSVRKMLLKAAEQDKKLSYSDIVKKNLKGANSDQQPVEEIYQDFSNLVGNLESQLSPKKTQVHEEINDVPYYEDYFKVWRHNLSTGRLVKRIKKSQEPMEQILATANILHQLDNERISTDLPTKQSPIQEEIFAQWRHNLADKSTYDSSFKRVTVAPKPELIFADWNHNLDSKVKQDIRINEDKGSKPNNKNRRNNHRNSKRNRQSQNKA